MARPLLRRALSLREGDAQIRRQKQWIVPEAAFAARRFEALSLGFSPKGALSVLIDERRDAHVARTPIGRRAELAQEKLVVRNVECATLEIRAPAPALRAH